MSKPHYKSEPASRPETVKSTSRTKVATVSTPAADKSIPAAAAIEPCPTTALCPEEVRTRAFFKWEAAGRPEGDGVVFWLEAEGELQGSN